MTLPRNSGTNEDNEEEATSESDPFQSKNTFWYTKFATPLPALILLSLANLLLQAIMAGLFSSTVSTLEKRFHLQSQEVGIMSALFNVGQVFSLILLLFVGEDVNKPRWIAIGTFILALGTVAFSTPHFIAPTYIPNSEDNMNLCGNVTVKPCDEQSIRIYRFMFTGILVIMGFFSTPIFVYSIPYIDEHCTSDKSALYNGVFYAMGGAGPAVGFIIGGALLEIYTYIKNSESIVSSQEYFIGAWWLGYVILGFILILNAIFIYMLPKKLKVNKLCIESRREEVQRGTKMDATDLSVLETIRALAGNAPFVLVIISCSLNMMFILGFTTFGAKYLEVEFGLKPYIASIVFGLLAIIASFAAQLTSGFIISKLSLNLSQIIKYTIICSIISTIFSCGFFIHCPEHEFAKSNSTDSVLMQCNEDCNCTTDFYEPVCGSNEVTYFSPCHAGCQVKINETSYDGCSCAGEQAVEGKCNEEFCFNFIWYCVMMVCGIFTSIMTLVPMSQIRIRVVSFNLRVCAMALSEIFIIFFGIAGGRYLTGEIIDLSCEVWQTDCGEPGTCVYYDRWELARNMAIMIFIENFLIVLVYILMLILYKPTKENDDDAKIVKEVTDEIRVRQTLIKT